MDNYLLLAIVALKGVCLFVCWKAMRANSDHGKNGRSKESISEEEAKEFEKKMEKMLQQNHQLKKEIDNLR